MIISSTTFVPLNQSVNPLKMEPKKQDLPRNLDLKTSDEYGSAEFGLKDFISPLRQQLVIAVLEGDKIREAEIRGELSSVGLNAGLTSSEREHYEKVKEKLMERRLFLAYAYVDALVNGRNINAIEAMRRFELYGSLINLIDSFLK